jgi:hypothetical protein
MNKNQLVRRIVETLREELQVIQNATEMANEEVLPTEDLTESQREPRALEVSYLVDGQTKLAREIKESIAAYEGLTVRTFAPGEPVALTALVRLEGGGEPVDYFLGPKAGGMEIPSEGTKVFVLTPQSPLARRIIGRNIGDAIEVEDGARRRSLRIAAID